MARVCDISGKRPMVGNNVSHSNNKVKRKFFPNLHKKKFYYEEEDKWLTLKVTSSVLKTINKNGLHSVIKTAKEKGTLNTKAI